MVIAGERSQLAVGRCNAEGGFGSPRTASGKASILVVRHTVILYEGKGSWKDKEGGKTYAVFPVGVNLQ